MYELSRITKRYGQLAAVDGIDLLIPEGQCMTLIGPSGCGKSTLLRLMNGLIRPDAGRILFEGESLTQENTQALRHRMGYVIQEGGLFPHLSAQDNVALLARHLGRSQAEIKERVTDLAELVHLPMDLLARFPAQLSGGQRQRVSLMRALMLDPDVLLLDEPLGALDPMIRTELQRELREIFQSLQKTVVMVTHDLAEAAYLADRIVLLKSGRIVQQGTYQDLCENPSDPFVSHFIEAQQIHIAGDGGGG